MAKSRDTADDLVWHQLARVRDDGPICVEEARPPPGEKTKKLFNDGQEFAATLSLHKVQNRSNVIYTKIYIYTQNLHQMKVEM